LCPQVTANYVQVFTATKNQLQIILDGAATYSGTQELGAGCHAVYRNIRVYVPSPEFFWDILNVNSKQILENSGQYNCMG